MEDNTIFWGVEATTSEAGWKSRVHVPEAKGKLFQQKEFSTTRVKGDQET